MVRVLIEDVYTGEGVEYLCDDFVFAGSNNRGEVFTSTTDNTRESEFLIHRLHQEL